MKISNEELRKMIACIPLAINDLEDGSITAAVQSALLELLAAREELALLHKDFDDGEAYTREIRRENFPPGTKVSRWARW